MEGKDIDFDWRQLPYAILLEKGVCGLKNDCVPIFAIVCRWLCDAPSQSTIPHRI